MKKLRKIRRTRDPQEVELKNKCALLAQFYLWSKHLVGSWQSMEPTLGFSIKTVVRTGAALRSKFPLHIETKTGGRGS